LKGQLVLTTSANAAVAKKGSVAYDVSKAAGNHLVRELAIELAPLVRVNGVAPATVVQGSAMFPRDRVIGSLAKYNIPYTDDEATESLVKKLAQFYADRTLTKAPITPADQAEAYFLLVVSQRLSKTTGQIITVDGGLHEAFLRWRLIANISIPQTSPDAGMFTAFTNHWDTMIKGEDDYAAVQTNQPSRPYYAFFTAGAEFLNPYVVSVPNATVHGTGTLTNAGSSTVGFLEFDYINRHVLRADGAYYGPSWLFKPGTHFYPDAQFNIGFLLGGGAGLTNTSYSAQTLAGADFYSQFTLGIPIVRLDRPEQSHQISVELSGGVTTESQFEIVHPNAFAGLGYQVAFKPIIGLATTNNCGFFSARFGAGWVDVPSLVGTNNLVNLDGNGIPIFDFKPSCEFGAYLAYPLTQSTYLTVDANTFFGDNPPNSWNIKVGLSIPLEKISGIFTQ
jgi:hypothetical protein